MTSAERSLATPSLTDKQLRTRIELAQRSFGLQQANQTQLNIVYLLCQRWELDPLTDITLFEGRPWVTIDGRVKLMRRHPEYRGYSCRPLSRGEKEAWGYDADDIVVECTVRTVTWGEISARGKVSAAEVQAARNRAAETGKRSAPIGMHPVEIAEKRAIARAERAAFGQDAVLDEEEAVTIIEERNDPERVALNAAAYDRIYGSEADGSAFADMPRDRSTEAQAERATESGPEGTQEAEPERSALVASYRALLADAARKLGPAFVESEWMLAEDASDEEIESRGVELSELVANRTLAHSKLREQAYQKNAALLADATAAGLAAGKGLRTLKAQPSDSLEVVIRKNSEIGARLRSRAGEDSSADPAQQGAF